MRSVASEERSKLEDAAYAVAEEYREGRFAEASAGWKETWASLRKELERRSPGFTPAEYDEALEKGFRESR